MDNVRIRRDDETTRLRVVLRDSHDPEALGEALATLVLATRNLEKLLSKPRRFYLQTTFHTPKRTFLRERAFFERCVRHPALRDAMAAYARNVNSRKRGVKGMSTDLGHSDMRPAGCFAYVPLALRDPKYIELFIESMWGTDMDHETFHAALIEELLVRHGLCDETMRLLAFRAVEAAGQDGERNLKLAYAHHGLAEKLASRAGLEAFAKLVDETCERRPGPARPKDGYPRHYRELYVANAGKALFQREPQKLAQWLDYFRGRGLRFSSDQIQIERARDAERFGSFREEWLADD